ncbi:MAG: hypothetical protein U0935_13355 [Pirellulales bacterium]
MKKFVAATAVAILALAGVALAVEPVKSGLPVGQSVGAFNVKDCTGPNQGRTLCYRCQYGNRPVVAVFTRRTGADLSELVKGLDEAVGKNKDKELKAFVVYLTDDPDAAEPKLKEMAASDKISPNVPLTVFQTSEGPDNYEIAKSADVTVLVWNKSKVQANAAFGKGQKLSAEDISKVLAATSQALK